MSLCRSEGSICTEEARELCKYFYLNFSLKLNCLLCLHLFMFSWKPDSPQKVNCLSVNCMRVSTISNLDI